MSWWEEEEEQIWDCGRSDSVLERLRNQPIYSPPPSPTSVFLISPQLYFSQPPPLTPQLHFSPPPTTSVPMFPCLDFSPLPSYIGYLRSLRSLYITEVRSLRSLAITEVRSLPSLSITNVIRHIGQIEHSTMPVSHKFSFCSRKDTRYLVTISEDTVIDTPQNLEEIALWLQSNPNTQHDRSSPRLIASTTDIGEIRQCHSSKPLKRNLEDSLRDFGSAWEVALTHLNKLMWWLPLKLNTDLLVHSLWEAVELAKPNSYEELFEEMTQTCESLPLGCFLPPKSKKMVSIWSWLSVVKISRKISIQLFQVLPLVQLPQTVQIVIVEEKMTQSLGCSGEFISQMKDCSLVEERSEKKNTRDKLKRSYKRISVITREDLEQNFGSSREDVANSFGVSVSTLKRICRQHGISRWPFQPERKKERLMEVISPSMHEKHDSRLRCIRTPLHVRSSPRTIALLDGGEMMQLDSSKQQSLVEFDVPNNSAHLVRASQSCSTISHSDETNSRETLKRKSTTESVLSFEDLQQHFGCKRDDAAKALGVSISTVKRTCRQHEIPRWSSRKKKKVSKMDCILLEPQGEKDVSPTSSKMPTDGQIEIENEVVGHLQDQNEGPNLLNTKNGSNKESITTLIFQDSVPVSEMDCILFEPDGEKNVSPTCKTPTIGIVLDFIGSPNLSNTENHSNEESITTTFQDSVPVFERNCILLEPQGEKNVSPTHKTPTDGQIEVANGMVGHIQDQNGIVPEFIEGPNLSNTEIRSNEKSLTTPNFQGSISGNYSTMDFSISSTDKESGEAGGSKDSRNFSTSAVGFLMGEHVSESSWTMPLCFDLAPMQTMTTIPHIMPHLTEKQDIRTVTFKAQYRDKKIKFRLSLPSGIVELKKQVTNRLGELGSFEVHYEDNDNEWILIGCDTDVWDCFELSSSSGNEVVRLLVRD